MLTMYIWLFNIHESPFSRSFSKSVLYESCRICRREMMVVFVSLYGFRMVHMKLSCCFRKLFFFLCFFSELFGTSFAMQFFQLLFHLSFCCLNNSTDTELFFLLFLVKGFMSGIVKWIAMSWNVRPLNILRSHGWIYDSIRFSSIFQFFLS